MKKAIIILSSAFALGLFAVGAAPASAHPIHPPLTIEDTAAAHPIHPPLSVESYTTAHPIHPPL
ncbi:hypothetical protein [Bacillus sp. EB01]|uniref:hypothetical protein n=1 Tax=Bacillus sp. EB01 TaxID=1347086 RepID=UPI0005C67762|nr:hypothetical protein [Bacillus sp. EB01]